MYVPEEIFDLINTTNINLYKTCKQFYQFKHCGYKLLNCDYKRWVDKNVIVNTSYFRPGF